MGLFDQICPDLDGEVREGEDVGPRGIEVLCDLGKLVGGVVQQPVELGLDGAGIGLVVDRVEHGLDRHQSRPDSITPGESFRV